MKTAILILAAGKSTRMGRPKLLLPVKQQIMLNMIIDNALQTKADTVHVVLGADAEQIMEAIKDQPVDICINENHEQGLGSSIVKGLESLLDHDEVLILLADQPSIDIDYLNDLISGLQENNKTIIASKYGDIYGVPAIFPSHYFPELLKLKGDQGAKQLLNSGTILVKSINSSVNLFDVDTPEDYQKLIQDQ